MSTPGAPAAVGAEDQLDAIDTFGRRDLKPARWGIIGTVPDSDGDDLLVSQTLVIRTGAHEERPA
jgi:hypothetical protein